METKIICCLVAPVDRSVPQIKRRYCWAYVSDYVPAERNLQIAAYLQAHREQVAPANGALCTGRSYVTYYKQIAARGQ